MYRDESIRMPNPNPLRWQALAAPATIVTVALILLGSAIEQHSIYYDEAITMLQLSGNPRPQWPSGAESAATLKRLLAGEARLWEMTADLLLRDNHPPFYYWVGLVWRRMFGESLEALRWLSALCVIVQALLVWRIAAHLRWPLLAALLYLTCGLVIQFGSIARDYGMASLWILVAMTATVGRPGLRNSIIAGIAGGLALATHYVTLLPVAVVAAVFAFRCRRQRRREALLPIAMVGLSGLGLAPFVIRRAAVQPDFIRGFRLPATGQSRPPARRRLLPVPASRLFPMLGVR